jgi:PAS domain S-box-containing protein
MNEQVRQHAQQMAEKVRVFDWASTPLGPIASWPRALHNTLGFLLNSGFPMWLAWGDSLTYFYNDAFRPLQGSQPEPLGKPLAEISADAWPTIAPLVEQALRGEACYREDFAVTLARGDRPERTWWTVSYSPVFGEAGEVSGVLCVSHETTREVNTRSALSIEREQLARLFEQAPSNVAFVSGPDHVYELVNERHRRYAAGRELIGKTVREAFPEVESQGVIELLNEVYRSGVARVENGLKIGLADEKGALRDRYLDVVFQPIAADDGKVTGIFVEGHDVTERVAAEAALIEREERLRLAMDAGRMGAWDLDVGSDSITLSPGALTMLGLPHGRVFSIAELEALSIDGEFDGVRAALKEAQQRNDPYFEAECRHVHPGDGQIRWLLVRGRAEFVGASGALRCFGVLMDVTERKQAEERLLLLAREVDHRANNLLGSVQSIVNLTGAEDVAGFRERVRGRINALASAHRLLAESRWTGAGLARVVAEELEPYREAHVRIDGPDAQLSPAVAQAVAIALHELATNAAKHGSLSRAGGRTLVTWGRPDDKRLVHMTWQELGGPPASPPTRLGFGMTLLQRAFSGQPGGSVEFTWLPEGLRCRLSVPIL